MNPLGRADAWPPSRGPGGRRRALCTLMLASLGMPRANARAADHPAGTSHWFTSSDGVKLHYVDTGSARSRGPELVLVPGWCMPAWVWAAQVEHFAQTHRVIAFDPRGQGQSEVATVGYDYRRRAADIAELFQAAKVEQAVLVGWSLGVLESLQALSDTASTDLRPRVKGLVLVDNSVGEGTPPAPPPPGRPGFLARLRTRRRGTVRAFVRSMFKQPQPEAWLDKLTEAALRVPAKAAIALLSQGTPREFWRNTLYALDMPVLYVITPKFGEQGALVQQRRASIQSVVFDDAGHALFVDQAARFNELLSGFLARLPEPTTLPR